MYRVKEGRCEINGVWGGLVLVGCASPDDLLNNWKWLVGSNVLVVCLRMRMPDVLASRSPVLLVTVFGSLSIKVTALKR